MDKEVEKFKADCSNLKDRVKQIKKRLLAFKKEAKDIKKEARSIANASFNLYHRGIKTMYKKVEGSDTGWKPKFSGLNSMMDNLESFNFLDSDILRALQTCINKQ